MASESQTEVYRQRYETYRHLDKLRWQMLQIAVAAGSLSLALGRSSDTQPNWWVFVIVGLVLIVLGLVMERIRHGISMNNEVLREVGPAVGDNGIPPLSTWRNSYSAWVAFSIIGLGVVSIIIAMCKA